MHHTISDSSIQPTQRTSKSAPKFLPKNHDENVCQPLCIGSWAESANWSPKHTSSESRDIPLSPQIRTARHTSSVLKSLKTQSDKIVPNQEHERERDQTHSYWYRPSAPRVNYSLLVMESTGMMKMATGEGLPPPAGCRNGSKLAFSGYGGFWWRNSRSIVCSGSFRIHGYIWVKGVRRWTEGGA